MSDQSTRVVKIGETELRVTRFKGLKGIHATAMVERVMQEIPDIQQHVDQYVSQFSKENSIKITSGMAKLPRYASLGLTPEDFTDGPIEIPGMPTGQQTMVAMLPKMISLARKELIRFLALMAIPNRDLEEADDNDSVDEALDKFGKKLMREGDIDELLELAVVAWEVLRDQILSKQASLGKLQSLPMVRALLDMLSGSNSTDSETEEMEEARELEETGDITAIFPDEQQNSSDSSQPSIDGADEISSTESPGSKSAPSSSSSPSPEEKPTPEPVS